MANKAHVVLNTEVKPDIPDFRKTFDGSAQPSFAQRIQKNPIIPAGIAGGAGAAMYGVYKLKQNRNIATAGGEFIGSHFMHTRVAAQGVVVGAIMASVVFTWLNNKMH